MNDLSGELLRYLIVLLTAPIWLPFVKALWQELERALRDEGGMFGRVPSLAEKERIEAANALLEDPLLSEPRLAPGERAGSRSRAAGTGRALGPARRPVAGPVRAAPSAFGSKGAGRRSGFR